MAGCAGLVLAPLLGAIAAAVRWDSGRPVLFRQERVGQDGQPFILVKFRTMRVVEERGPLVTAAGDSRITRVGRHLRRWKLDELPQLWNVFRGDMAIVGPRPEAPAYVALWPPEQRDLILGVKPGLTDPVTVSLRDEEGLLSAQPDAERYYREVLLPRKASGYADYVRSRSFRGDIGVVIRTLAAIVRR